MTSEGAMGWRARGFIALRIIRWNPRRASISDNGGWSVGGGMDVRGGGSGRRTRKLEKLPGALIQRGAGTDFNK